MWTKLLLLVAGGSLGAVSRYGVSLVSARWFGTGFPWGTLAVNLSGCFLIGLVFSLADQRQLLGPEFRLFFVTGFLGALTTFSTFGLESVNFLRYGALHAALLNILVNNICGLALVLIGMWVGRAL